MIEGPQIPYDIEGCCNLNCPCHERMDGYDPKACCEDCAL